MERSHLQPLIGADPATIEGIAQLVTQGHSVLAKQTSSSGGSAEDLPQRRREQFQDKYNKERLSSHSIKAFFGDGISQRLNRALQKYGKLIF